MSDIPVLIHWVSYDVGPPTLLRILSTRFRKCAFGPFLRSDNDVG